MPVAPDPAQVTVPDQRARELQLEVDRGRQAGPTPPKGLADETQRAVWSDELFRLLVQSVSDYAIFVLDPQGYVATWNAGAERIKGYSAAEIVGHHFSIFYPESDGRAGKCALELEIAA